MDKFKWYPAGCAPAKFPVNLIRGLFVFNDGSFVKIPASGIEFSGWGEAGSTHLTGDAAKLLPVKLDISWFSFSEDKFYASVIKLPFDIITNLFAAGFNNPDNGEKATYQKIIAGMAPGGFLSIWLAGNGIVTEACIFQATEANLRWEKVLVNPKVTRKDYIRMNLELALTANEISSLAKNGIPFGLWKKYRIKYAWEPWIIGKATVTGIWINTYNGEKEYVDYSLKPGREVKHRAVLSGFKLYWQSTNGKKYFALVSFDETEIFAAFAKLSGNDLSKKLKLQIEINDINQAVKVFIRDDKYLLEFKKCNLKVYLG